MNTDEYIEELFRGRGLSPLQVATAVSVEVYGG